MRALALIGLLGMAAAAGAAPPAPHLRVTLSDGGCVLHIRPDGAARIYYGAAPSAVHVAAGTFAFAELARELRQGSSAPSGAASKQDGRAKVYLNQDTRGRVVHDTQRAQALFTQAWSAREALHPESNQGWVGQACGLSPRD